MLIAVCGFKGGVGKTTTAVHVAAVLGRTGRVLLADGDPNGSALDWAGRGALPFETRAVQDVPTYDGYAHVVFDTEARPSLDDLRELAEVADVLLLPTTPDFLSLRALQRTVGTLDGLGAKYRVLLTMVPPFPSRDGQEARAFLAAHGVRVCEAEVKRAAAFTRAALGGVTVRELGAKAWASWHAYEQATGEVLRA